MKLTEKILIDTGWKKEETEYVYNDLIYEQFTVNKFTYGNFVIKHNVNRDTYNLYTDSKSSCSIPMCTVEYLIETLSNIKKINLSKIKKIKSQNDIISKLVKTINN